MKKIILVAAFAFICQFTFSQKFDFGAHGSAVTTWLLNKNVNDDGDEQDVEFTIVPHFGFHAGIYFSENFGIETGVSFGKFSQKYIGANGGTVINNARTDLKTLSIPFLIKLGSTAFFEFGIKYSSISKATHVNTLEGLNILYSAYGGTPGATSDVKGSFKSGFLSFVIGFGGNIELTDKLFITAGIRFAYSLSDVVGVDAFGNPLSESNVFLYDDVVGMYDSYKATNAAHAGFRLGLTFRLEN